MIEKTLTIIQPDCVAKSLIGEVIRRYEVSGLRVGALKMTSLTREFVELFFAEHKKKPFFEDYCAFMSSGIVVVMVLEGENAIETVKRINGSEESYCSQHGTIRGDYHPIWAVKKVGGNSKRGINDVDFGNFLLTRKILVHSSASEEAAKKEIRYCFYM